MKTIREIFAAVVGIGAFQLGLACAIAAVAARGGRTDAKLDVLGHFAPFWLAGGLTAVLVALAFRPWRLKLLLAAPGVVAVIAAASLVAPEYLRPMSPRAPADAPGQIKLIQFNAFWRNGDPEGTARWIADQDADVVVLEESREDLVDAVLRRRPYHVSGWIGRNVILSRAKPVDTDIPWPRQGPLAVITRSTFAKADGGFTVIGAHYAWPTDGELQSAQGQDIARVIAPFDKSRLIIAGDFNSTPWSFARRREDRLFGLERRTRGLATWPARPFTPLGLPALAPFLPIDHVYAGPAWRTVSVERGPRLGSDHYPVIVRLALAD